MRTNIRERTLPTQQSYHNQQHSQPLLCAFRLLLFLLSGEQQPVLRQAHAGRRAVWPDSPCSGLKPDRRGCGGTTFLHGAPSALQRGGEHACSARSQSRVVASDRPLGGEAQWGAECWVPEVVLGGVQGAQPPASLDTKKHLFFDCVFCGGMPVRGV